MSLQQDTNYHRFLRTAALVCALVLAFESGLVRESTKDISEQTHLYLANVIGMSAAVQPNELNLITAELTKMERELAAREAALREREIAVELSTGVGSTGTTTYILASVLFILLLLIVLNYALDYLRSRELRNA